MGYHFCPVRPSFEAPKTSNMENILYTIEPEASGSGATIALSLLVSLAALAGLAALLRKPASGEQYNRKMLAAMLLFFTVLIGSGTAFFSWLKSRKTSDIIIYTDAVETPYGRAEFGNIKNAAIELDKQPSFVNPGRAVRQTRLLVIEEKNGKAHIMSEKDYDLQELMDKLREAVKAWEKGPGAD